MRGAANHLRNERANVEAQLQALRNYIANLVSSGFVTTAASVAFDDTYQRFTQAATTTINELNQLAQFLDTAANQMEETDNSLANAIR